MIDVIVHKDPDIFSYIFYTANSFEEENQIRTSGYYIYLGNLHQACVRKSCDTHTLLKYLFLSRKYSGILSRSMIV
jgi:hypothetical protein